MSRRQVSPIRTALRSEVDPRENMIRKLKEDLIVARGREKELALLENYLVELIEKTKLVSAEKVKSDEEGRLKLELTLKSINELKKEVDLLRAEFRNVSNELGAFEAEEAAIKKQLNSRFIEIEKLKKEGLSLHEENEKLINEHYRIRTQEDECHHQLKKLTETIRNYENRLSEINRKILEAKAYINEVDEENAALKERLKTYEHENAGIFDDLDKKESNFDLLERTFAEKHEFIKNQVEGYIELEYQNQRSTKEAKHKGNLVKIENEKSNELSAIIKKLDKTVIDRSKELTEIKLESGQINRINQDFAVSNGKLKQDLLFCQEHLHNLIKHNAFVQEEMENYVREDDAIISIIRRKRLVPVTNNYLSMRSSRNQLKNSNRTYQ